MSSERRLHPASILFDCVRYARIFVWPALLAFLGGSRGGAGQFGRYSFDGSGFEAWLWVLVLPSVGLSVARYLSYRYRYEEGELVIRSGVLFRNVRHLPYARIQNLDAVQNVLHRAFGVVEVRIETGGGTETEARMRVVPQAALDEMRARVFQGRTLAAAATPALAPSPGSPSALVETPAPRMSPPVAIGTADTLLHLPVRELLLCGVLENKGMVLVGAAYGFLWEAGALNQVWSWLFDGSIDARGLFREVLAAVAGTGPLPLGRLGLALGGVAGFLVLVRMVSMVWAFVRLYDFRLTRSGEDLRASFGLFTRVNVTIPLRRVQTLTVHQGWLHRKLGRASLRVETAGGQAGAATRDREWVAPLVRVEEVPRLVEEILPGGTLAQDDWQRVHPRAFRRAVKRSLLVALLLSAVAAAALGWRALPIALVLVTWSIVSTRQHVEHLRWAFTGVVVALRSGWLSRHETLVKVNRVQAVTARESPFDRRASMARVRVDTAGAGELSHRVDIPYLAADVARDLRQRLARRVAETAFHW